MGTANMANGTNPDQTLTFSCPANCSRLWLVVSGAPQEHWRHAWDDDNSNDEHWPYQVKFVNTNLLGQTLVEDLSSGVKKSSPQIHPSISSQTVRLYEKASWQITNLAGKQIGAGYGNIIDISAFSNGGYILKYSGRHFKLFK
ncbi:MAG: hypothetical protein GX556_14490 [Fibrobacter sp.]|mgnify:CR=1 FL=1|nr:hypothetical protein [Fibrobacter sp.]